MLRQSVATGFLVFALVVLFGGASRLVRQESSAVDEAENEGNVTLFRSEQSWLGGLDRLKDRITVSGTLTYVRHWQDAKGKGDRVWWALKFREGHKLLIKMWNGEIDMHKNHRWFQTNVPRTIIDDLDDDVKYNLNNARFTVTNWQELDQAKIYQKFTLHLKMSAASPPRHGSCWKNAALTMKRSVKGWFGMYQQRHLNLQQGNNEKVKGTKGAKTLQVLLRLWSLMHKLETLWNSWKLQASDNTDGNFESDVAAEFAAVTEETSEIGSWETEEKIKSMLDEWKPSLTEFGAKEAVLREIRAAPPPGTAVLLASGEIVRVEHVENSDKIFENETDKNFDFHVITKTLDGSTRRMSSENWANEVVDYTSAEKTFGWQEGSEGIRYNRLFRLLQAPIASKETPIEGSLWARVQQFGQKKMVFALVTPNCKGHPLLGTTFRMGKSSNTSYVVTDVDVVNEAEKVIMIKAEKTDTPNSLRIQDAWPDSVLKVLIKNKQLLLSVYGKDGTMRITSCHGDKVEYEKKKKKSARKLSLATGIGLIEGREKAHNMIVARRAANMLILATAEVWDTDYFKDDKAKLVKKSIDIAWKVIIGLITVGLVVSITGILVAGLPVLFTSGFAAAMPVFMGSVWTFWAGNVFGNAMNLTPNGIPNLLFQTIRRNHLAALMSRGTLMFAEQIGATAVASSLCPVGSGLQDKSKTKDKDVANDQYAMCKRHHIRKRLDVEQKKSKKDIRRLTGEDKKQKYTKEEKALERFDVSMLMVQEFAQTFSAVSEMECEVVPQPDNYQRFRFRERWTLMPRQWIPGVEGWWKGEEGWWTPQD